MQPDCERPRAGSPSSVKGIVLDAADTVDVRRQKMARIILDSMYQFLGLLDVEGTVLEINRAALDGAGLCLEQVLGKPFWQARWWAVSEEVRERVRHWFGIPDRGRILLSLGTPADSTTAQHYLALVQPLTAARNDLCAIIAGVTPDAPCWNDCREDMATLVATRQLFLAESLHDRDAFLLAADAFLALDAGSLERDGANAIEAGLLVLCPTGCNTPFGQATTAPGQVIDTPSADAACAALHAWLDATPRD